MSQIKIRFKPDGKTDIEVFGAPGGSCINASQPYRDGISGNVAHEQKTDEFYEEIPEIVQERLNENG